MGFLKEFGRRRYERRYRAAWTTYLAYYTYAKLEPADALRVHALAVDFDRQVDPIHAVAVRLNWWRPWALRHAAAMHALGIPPALAEESWPFTPADARRLLKPSRIVRPLIDRAGTTLMQRWARLYWDFHWFDPATTDALADLKGRGIDVEPLLPDPLTQRTLDWPRNWQYPTWRDWWTARGGANSAG